MKITTKLATVAAAGAMAVSALIPAGAAFAQGTNNYYLLNGGYGFGIGGNGYNGTLGQLFVLGALFNGPYGNGVVGGTSLGSLLMLNQIFNGGGYGGGWGGWGY